MRQEDKLEFLRVMDALFIDFQVRDILLPTSNCIFLLESPHIQELKYGAPVSGASGATMTKHLFGDAYAKYPLGLLVKKNAIEQKNRPRLSRIGLMNVCNIPMQASAYGDSSVTTLYQPWLAALGAVRSDNQRDLYRDESQNTVQAVILERLRDKLSGLVTRTCTIIPCGRFAQKFFRLADVHSPHWRVIDGVPHPSYNSWDRAQYAGVIGQVVAALGQLVSQS